MLLLILQYHQTEISMLAELGEPVRVVGLVAISRLVCLPTSIGMAQYKKQMKVKAKCRMKFEISI